MTNVRYQKLSDICCGDKLLISQISDFILNDILFTEPSVNGKKLKEPHELNEIISKLCEYKEGVNLDYLKYDLLALAATASNPKMISTILGV